MASFLWFKNKKRNVLRSLSFVEGGQNDAVELCYDSNSARASKRTGRKSPNGLGLKRINCMSHQSTKKPSPNKERNRVLPFSRSTSSGGFNRSKTTAKVSPGGSSKQLRSTTIKKTTMRPVQDTRTLRSSLKKKTTENKATTAEDKQKTMKHERTGSSGNTSRLLSFTEGKIRFEESSSGDLPPARPSELKVHFLEPTLSDLTRATDHSSDSSAYSGYDDYETESTWADTEYAFSVTETIQPEDEMDFFFKCF